VVVFYNCSRGINFASPAHRSQFLEAIGSPKDPPALNQPYWPEAFKALPLLEQALLSPELRGQLAVIFEDPELIWPQSEYSHMNERDRINLATLRRWARSSEFIAAGQVVLLVTPTISDLHVSLRATSSMIESVEIPFPSAHERAAFINNRLAADSAVVLAENITPVSFASLTGGLSRVLVDDICLRASLTNTPVSLQLIKDRKDQIIRQEFGELIEILEPRHGFEHVGGMQEVKDYLRRSVIAPLRGETTRDRMPSGVMLAGPPGTGKTYLVSALAHEAGVNVVKLNAGRLLGQYVGMSERNLEKALACIRSLAPTLVMIDEIEQQFQRGGKSDGGVERRIFGRILEEMSGSSGTRRGDVVWFAATNRVDQVDPALRRPGRFDRIVPILPPTGEERGQILATKLPPGTDLGSHDEQRAILAATENYTGADLDGVMVKAVELAYDDNRAAPRGSDILLALQLLRPSSGGDEVAQMIHVALEHCNDLSLIPMAWRARAAAVHAGAGIASVSLGTSEG
jgi:AAA+ superfamily predicted ATPase